MSSTTISGIAPLVPPTRRAILVAGVAGLFAAAGFGIQDHADATHGHRDDGPRHAASPGAVVATPSDSPTAVRPAEVASHRGAPAFRSPVRTLDDYHRHAPHVAFAPQALMLTLDDGPSPVWTPRFLTLLEQLDITATFFLIGRQVPANRGIVREIAARGHAIGNHTWTHDELLGQRSPVRIRSELDRTNEAIHAVTGRRPTLFRAPGGNWNRTLLHVLADEGLVPVGWDVDPSDWSRPGTKAIQHSLRRARAHDIALCHDGGGERSQTYEALRVVLPELLRRGHAFTTLPGTAAG